MSLKKENIRNSRSPGRKFKMFFEVSNPLTSLQVSDAHVVCNVLIPVVDEATTVHCITKEAKNMQDIWTGQTYPWNIEKSTRLEL